MPPEKQRLLTMKSTSCETSETKPSNIDEQDGNSSSSEEEDADEKKTTTGNNLPDESSNIKLTSEEIDELNKRNILLKSDVCQTEKKYLIFNRLFDFNFFRQKPLWVWLKEN